MAYCDSCGFYIESSDADCEACGYTPNKEDTETTSSDTASIVETEVVQSSQTKEVFPASESDDSTSQSTDKIKWHHIVLGCLGTQFILLISQSYTEVPLFEFTYLAVVMVYNYSLLKSVSEITNSESSWNPNMLRWGGATVVNVVSLGLASILVTPVYLFFVKQSQYPGDFSHD